MKHSLVIALLAAGCVAGPTPVPTTSSRAFLGPARSEAEIYRPMATAALDITLLFAQRGFPLVDQQPTRTGLVLRLKGSRKTVTNTVGKHDTYSIQYGSVFYVFLEPRGEDRAHVAMIGRATSEDREVCTADPGYELGPCNQGLIWASGSWVDRPWVDDDLRGRAEAEIVQGVFSELRLQGLVPPLELAAEQTAIQADERAAAHERCLVRRREVFDAARRIDSSRARANVLRTLPTCDS